MLRRHWPGRASLALSPQHAVFIFLSIHRFGWWGSVGVGPYSGMRDAKCCWLPRGCVCLGNRFVREANPEWHRTGTWVSFSEICKLWCEWTAEGGQGSLGHQLAKGKGPAAGERAAAGPEPRAAPAQLPHPHRQLPGKEN